MAVIPGKNPAALISYYLGIFSVFPCVGYGLGLAAIIFGIIGLVRAGANPEIEGKGHAITGILLGIFLPNLLVGLGILFWFLTGTH